MIYPYIDDIGKLQEVTSMFAGYQHNDTCAEGAFYDMKNITTEHFPVLCPRRRRGIENTYTNFQGAIEKDGNLCVVDDGKFYIAGEEQTGFSLDDKTFKTIVAMGAILVFFPDKKWYNTADNTYGSLDNEVNLTGSVSFTLCGADGTDITWHDASYYNDHTPQNGDYKMETVNGRTTLSVYSSATGLWAIVATTYMKIAETGIGANFKEGDGVKVTVDLTGVSWDYAANIFVNDEGSGKRSNTFTIKKLSANYITVPALLNENKTLTIPITVERTCPDMSFVIECQNRLWGCKPDGHEIYCSKLGDCTNWNVFQGISTDSWAATVGSDGEFTGAIAYMGYPMFFKENSYLRVSISSIGAHQYKETIARGVEKYSERSLVQLNEVLLYKSHNAICMYDGSFPSEISENLGEWVRYHNAIGGSINNRYYVSMEDDKEQCHLFVYDIKTGLWAKEDNVPVTQFCNVQNDMAIIADNVLYSVYHYEWQPDLEEPLDWFVESGKLQYDRITNLSGKAAYTSVNNKKYLSKFDIRMQLDVGSRVALYICYDSSDVWEFQWDMSGKGQKTFTIPVRPHRCDHLQYKLVGHGEAKIFSITKFYTQGSDR